MNFSIIDSVLTFGDVVLTTRPSFLRTAASAYRSCVRTVQLYEVERALFLYGDVAALREGNEYLILDPRPAAIPPRGAIKR